MVKQKKDSKTLNCNIERAIYEQLEQYCDEVGQTKTMAVERILKQFFDTYYATSSTRKEDDHDKLG